MLHGPVNPVSLSGLGHQGGKGGNKGEKGVNKKLCAVDRRYSERMMTDPSDHSILIYQSSTS